MSLETLIDLGLMMIPMAGLITFLAAVGFSQSSRVGSIIFASIGVAMIMVSGYLATNINLPLGHSWSTGLIALVSGLTLGAISYWRHAAVGADYVIFTVPAASFLMYWGSWAVGMMMG